MHNGGQFRQTDSAITQAYPDAYQCAVRLKAVLELRLGQPITEEETGYLTLHVARLAADDRLAPRGS